MSGYVPRTKQQRVQLRTDAPVTTSNRVYTLKGCGHQTSRQPEISNPDRWWCCGAFREKKI